jgi:hypothetical protein
MACGLLLLLFQAQGVTSAGDDRDQDQICHTVQRHSPRLGAKGFKMEGTGPIASMAIHNFQITEARFEEKETNFIICGKKVRIGTVKALNLCCPTSERKCPPFQGVQGVSLNG